MKMKVTEERVFPTLGIVAKPGDTVTIPDDVVVSAKPEKGEDVKEGDE